MSTLARILLTFTALAMPVTSISVPPSTFDTSPGQAITPPGIFFAIWGVIIVSCWAVAVVAWVKPESAVLRAAAWPLVVAQAGFSVWLVFAGLPRSAVIIGSIGTVATFAVIIASLLVAMARMRGTTGQWRWVIAGTVGMYAGWSSAAIWLNVITDLPESWANSPIVQTAGVAAAAAGVVAVIVLLRPSRSYAVAVIWALIGIASSAASFSAWAPFVVALVGIVIVIAVDVRSALVPRKEVATASA